MFETLFKLYHQKNTFHLFIISFIVFAVLNVIENVIHYNIGKYHEANTPSVNGNGSGNGSVAGFHFTNPSNNDWVRIVVIMFIFAVLQGFFTSYFSVC